MDENQILETLRSLACSQGSYSRLYHALIECKNSDPISYNDIMDRLVEQKFSTPVDLILYIEE